MHGRFIKMISRLHRIVLVAIALFACSLLGGCASINERAAAAMGDYVPKWAGGLPADAPPRPGTAKYDEWMREREQQRLLPADPRATSNSASASSASAPSATGSTASGTSTSDPPPIH